MLRGGTIHLWTHTTIVLQRCLATRIRNNHIRGLSCAGYGICWKQRMFHFGRGYTTSCHNKKVRNSCTKERGEGRSESYFWFLCPFLYESLSDEGKNMGICCQSPTIQPQRTTTQTPRIPQPLRYLFQYSSKHFLVGPTVVVIVVTTTKMQRTYPRCICETIKYTFKLLTTTTTLR